VKCNDLNTVTAARAGDDVTNHPPLSEYRIR